MKTIKQIADEIGVSKQAVQKRIAREPLYTSLRLCISTNKGTKYIDEIGEHLIKTAFSLREETTGHIDVADNRDNHVDTLISMLQRELDAKNEQLAAKDEQIDKLTAALENTTASLHAAQALHAGTMQKQLTDGGGDHTEPDTPPKRFFARIFGRKSY